MKIRNKRLLAAASWLVARITHLLFRTLRHQIVPLGRRLDPDMVLPGERFIWSVWHENVLLPVNYFSRPDIAVLISSHADGQLLGAFIEMMGMNLVHGSTNRGGVRAVRQLLADSEKWRHLAITPDGPRGPRRIVQPGVVYLASRTGRPIIPSGVAYTRPWRFNSWDKFAIPKPFSRAFFVTAEPIFVPDGLKTAELEPYRLLVQSEMDRMNALAEQLAAGRKIQRDGEYEPTVRRAS
jgi:lysophospholipid acyltransferase (LPLAT)-like uncharacterized protein